MPEVTVVLCGSSLSNLENPLIENGLVVLHTDVHARELGSLPEHGVNLMLLDAEVLENDLLEVIERLEREPGLWPIVVSTRSDPAMVVTVIRAGAVDFVHRGATGFDPGALAARLAALPERLAGNSRALDDELTKVMRKFQHDVKNPINNILGYAELLLDNPTTKIEGEPAQFIERIRINGMQALDILKKLAEQIAGMGRK